jgi:TctA family transporter
VGRLWRGDLALAEAFWTHAVLGVTVASLVATAASLTLLSAGAPPLAAVAVHLSPAPYIVVAVAGVWRSADCAAAAPAVAALARWTALAWGIVMVVA